MADLILKVFDTDDATLLFEVGTAKGHANPYLAWPDELTPSEIDLLNGGGSIGEMTLRVIDPQTGATKADRWLTSRLGVPSGQQGAGHSRLNGRRALLQTVSGRTLRDGTITRTTLTDSFAGFTFSLRDIRERPREVAVFTSAARRDVSDKITHAPAVFPRGRLGGYGKLPIYDILVQTTSQALANRFGYVVPPVAPMKGYVEYLGVSASDGVVMVMTDIPASGSVDPKHVLTDDMWEAMGRPQLIDSEGSGSNYRPYNRLPDVRVLWRDPAAADQTWKEVEVVGWDVWNLFNTAVNRFVEYVNESGETVREKMRVPPSEMQLGDGSTGSDMPPDATEIEFVVVYVGEPTEAYPLTWEGPTAQFMRGLYDGDLSDRDPRVRYDAVAVDALPYEVRIRATERRDSLRDVEEEVYRALGYAPAVVDGLVTPVSSNLPGAGELPTITDDNAQAIPGWEHGTSDAITEVVVRYHRDYFIPPERDPRSERTAGDGIASRDVTHRAPGPDWAKDLVGDHKHEIDAWVFRALGTSAGGPAEGLTVMDETGAGLAKDRGFSLLDRWLFGGQVSACRLRTDDFPNLKPGDWVIDDRSWRPNYVDLSRGGNVLAQVISLQPEADAWLDVVLIDAGPSGQPLAAPTLGTLTVDESTNVVTAPLTGVPAGEDAAVEYAFSSTEPAGDSSSWTPGGRRTGDGSISLPPTPAGAETTVWVRARSVGVGKRPSGWTAAKSIAVSGTPTVSDVRVVLGSDGSAVIWWRPNVDTLGARLHYGVDVIDTTVTIDTTVDVNGQGGSHTLPAGTVKSGFQITVDVEPWSGWDGTTVSGAAGVKRRGYAQLEPVAPDAPQIDLVETQNIVGGQINLSKATIDAVIALGVDGRAPVEYRYRVSDPTGVVTAFGSWAEIIAAGGTTGTAEITVTRGRYARHVTLEARDADGRTASKNITVDRHPFQNTDLTASVTFNASNEALVQVNAPEGAANIYITAAVDTDPTDPTSSAYDATIPGPSGQANTGVVVAEGSVAHVKVRAGSDGGIGVFLAKNTEGGIITASISFNALNETVVTANGPAGTTALYMNVGADTEPVDPTTTTYDAVINDQSGTVNTGVVVAEGSIAFVRIAPYDGTALGNVVAFSASNAAAKAAPVAYIRVQSQSATVTTLEYDGSDGTEGRSVATAYQRRIDTQTEDGTDIEGTWSAWSATLPATEAVARDIYPQTVHLRVKDADGRQSSVARIEVPGNAALLNLQNFRETELGDTVLWEWTPGSLVSEVWVYYETHQKPVIGDPWPTNQAGREPDEFLPVGTNSFRFTKPVEGHKAFLQFEPRDEDWRAGDVLRASVHGIPDVKPQIAYIGQATATTPAPNKTNVVASITDSLNRSGRLTAWLNRAGYTEPNPDAASDGYIDLTMSGGSVTVTDADAWVLTGGGTANLFRDLVLDAERGKRIFLQWVSDDGEDTGVQDKLLHSWSRILDQASGGLAPDVVTTAAIANAAVEAGKIADGAATAAKIATNAITATKITDGAIETPKLAAGAVTTAKITAGAITAGTIAAGAIEAAKIAAGAVTTAKLDALAVSADKIAANAVTAAKINVAELSEISAGVGIVTSGVLRNSGNTRGIRLDAADTLPAGWTTYLDLGATLSAPILKHPKLSLNADGSATFSGVVTIDSGTNYAAGYDPSTKETPAGAQAKADAAESDAKTYASGLVSPLSAIIRSTTQPTAREDASALQSGDVWIETDNGDKPYVWNGSSFVEQYTKIDGGYITTGAIVSSTYVAGSAGWKIDTAGGAEFNDVTVRGALDGATGTFAGEVSGGSFTAAEATFSGKIILPGTMEIRAADSDVTLLGLREFFLDRNAEAASTQLQIQDGNNSIAGIRGTFNFYTRTGASTRELRLQLHKTGATANGAWSFPTIPTITGTFTGSRSFTDADGNANYITISNGLITDWTQEVAP